MNKTLQGKYADKLNKQIEELYKVIDAKDKIINEQVLEIERLKEQLENDIDRYEDTISYQLGFDKGKEYLQQKIGKAIEYGKSCINEDLDVDKLDEEYKDIFKIAYEIHKHYLEILGDKE